MESGKNPKKILIMHYRVGKTDGVSIEIASWKEILESMGHTVKLASGPINVGADYVITELENQLNPTVYALDEQAFGGEVTYSEDEFNRVLQRQQDSIRRDFEKVLQEYRPDRIVISNIFCVGENIAATQPILEVLDQYQVPTLLIHHDFYWENIRYQKPGYRLIEEMLEKYFVPKREYITHACINSIGKQSIKDKKGIEAELVYDTLDFNQQPWGVDEYNGDILANWKIKPRDVVVLQATRIVRRKNIELAIDYVKALEKYFNAMRQNGSVTLYRETEFDHESSKIYLVLAGYAEKRDYEYFKELLHYAALRKVNLCYIGDQIGHSRESSDDGKRYSLWDAYSACDLITYPSEYEGFGNQLLEAVFAKKPVVGFEYPVFSTDIKDKGIEVISLGSEMSLDESDGLAKIPERTMSEAVEAGYQILTNTQEYSRLVETNFSIGKQNFSFASTAGVLRELLSL